MAHSGRCILLICMIVLLASLILASCKLSSKTTEPTPSITPLAPGSTASSPGVEPTLTPSLPSPSTSDPIVNRTTYGHIRWDETWRGEVRIVGDIIVESGFTLTIEPGTKVLIAANSDVENLNTDSFEMQKGIRQETAGEDPYYRGVHFGEPFRDEGNHISIRIMGTLYAVGTPTQVITITSSSETPSTYDWNYFQFEKGTMSYCRLEYYRCLNPGNDTTVTYNSLLNVGEAAVACDNRSMLIEHNTISYAGHELIDMHGGAPTIRYNNLGPNPDHVGIVIDGGSPYIANNSIEDCGLGITFVSPPGNPTIKDNTFIGNREDIHNFGDPFR